MKKFFDFCVQNPFKSFELCDNLYKKSLGKCEHLKLSLKQRDNFKFEFFQNSFIHCLHCNKLSTQAKLSSSEIEISCGLNFQGRLFCIER